MSASVHPIAPRTARRILPGMRTISLEGVILTQVHGMLISAVLRARQQLANSTSEPERELYELDLADCTTALDKFTQAVQEVLHDDSAR